MFFGDKNNTCVVFDVACFVVALNKAFGFKEFDFTINLIKAF